MAKTNGAKLFAQMMQGYGITLDRLRTEGWVRHPLTQEVPFADRKFYTHDGQNP